MMLQRFVNKSHRHSSRRVFATLLQPRSTHKPWYSTSTVTSNRLLSSSSSSRGSSSSSSSNDVFHAVATATAAVGFVAAFGAINCSKSSLFYPTQFIENRTFCDKNEDDDGNMIATNHVNNKYSNYCLLRNVNVKSDQEYTQELQISSEDLSLLNKQGVAWEAAKLDAKEKGIPVEEYIKNVMVSLAKFQVSDEVYDREDFKKFLEPIYLKNGQFKLIVGGKSVGKSLVLKDFTKKLRSGNKYLPLLVDARTQIKAPLRELICLAFKKYLDSGLFTNDDIIKLANIAVEVGFRKLPLLKQKYAKIIKDAIESKKVKDLIDEIFGSEDISDDTVVDSFKLYAQWRNKFPVLIIDEANLVKGLESEKKTADSPRKLILSPLLEYLTKETKQDKTMHVIMATSEYNFAYELEKHHGLKTEDIHHTLFAGEIPPKSMWDLLVSEKKGIIAPRMLPFPDDEALHGVREQQQQAANEDLIGMGENLATLLIACYGGHFLTINRVVEELWAKEEKFCLSSQIAPVGSKVLKCLHAHPKALELLRNLAKHGFVPVPGSTDAIEMIVYKNIAGLVTKGRSTLVGVKGWAGCKGDEQNYEYGLVPASQSARLTIAITVQCLKKKKRIGCERFANFLPWCK